MPAESTVSLKAALALLASRGAAELAHGAERTLGDHLRGTMRILSHWRQPSEVVAAGLLHSVYSTDIYRQTLIPLAERKTVAAAVGERAEQLVYFFGTIQRNSFFRAVSKARRDWKTIVVECHRSSVKLELSRRDVGDLLLIYMANSAEQNASSDHSPGSWISSVSAWGILARPLVTHVPPVFRQCSVRVDPVAEKKAVDFYRAAFSRLDGDGAAASAGFLSAAEHLPWVAEPVILLACCALRQFRWHDAFALTQTAIERLTEWGTAWDKRLTYDEWKSLALTVSNYSEAAFTDPSHAEHLARSGIPSRSANWIATLREFSEREVSTPPPLSQPVLPPRFEKYLAGFRKAGPAPKHNFYPGLSRQPVLAARRFSIVRALEEAYAEIRAEFRRLISKQAFHQETEKIDRTGSWDVFMFYELGRRNEEHCALCPTTASVIEKYGAVHSISSAAYFSILAPHTHVAAHKGPTNMRVRCHFGIEIPEGCRLRVAHQILHWRQGECLVFDDSFTHEVWNDSDKPRAVLVADLWHPDLSSEEVLLLNELQRYAYAHAQDMSGYWRRNERARAARAR